jgi:hypothetical protein
MNWAAARSGNAMLASEIACRRRTPAFPRRLIGAFEQQAELRQPGAADDRRGRQPVSEIELFPVRLEFNLVKEHMQELKHLFYASEGRVIDVAALQ